MKVNLKAVIISGLVLLAVLFQGCTAANTGNSQLIPYTANTTGLPENPNKGVDYTGKALKEIWLAGGCFWGVEAYLARVYGVADTDVGYANGKTENPSYEDVSHRGTGHAETVHVQYDPERVDLKTLLEQFFTIIDPVSVNKQGNDIGSQYRTGIYYEDKADLETINAVMKAEQEKYSEPLAVEATPLKGYYKAEEYHQDYLEKNPNGYCHIDFSSLKKQSSIKINPDAYKKPGDATLKKILTKEQFSI